MLANELEYLVSMAILVEQRRLRSIVNYEQILVIPEVETKESAVLAKINKMIEEKKVEFIDLRFTGLNGAAHHVTLAKNKIDTELLRIGKTFDGSSIPGWRKINKSDLVLMPDLNTARLDPFTEVPTLMVWCDVLDPTTQKPYLCDPRAVAHRAELYLKDTGIADTSYFGQEVEFFIFDNVRWDLSMNGCFYKVDSDEGVWNGKRKMKEGNRGHRPGAKGGYFSIPPIDSAHDLRSFICQTLRDMGLQPEVHHHEVATSNQSEIVVCASPLRLKADEMQIFKYGVQNVAHSFGKSVTFMPKPLVGDNGSGMHCHQSLAKNGKNLFAGKEYAGLSQLALYYIGGIIKHARALNALTNPATNSYKRLVPGFEAPVTMVYSAANRSAAIRIPYAATEKAKRIEVRFPDCLANPYLAFSALLMAGLDGIRNKIHPGEAVDENLYDVPLKKVKAFPHLCSSLEQALDSLEEDHVFLFTGDVFNEEILNAYIKLKREEVAYVNAITHPAELGLYYSL
ncbi:MAG: glnA [Gammaproteobacteria bacterium]|jgi:glutamine synthetase|nr:glnA [Gammaproteobacteria bacterium]